MYGDRFKEFVCGGGLGSALKLPGRSFQRSGDYKLRTRECVFLSRKCSFYASFDLSVTQSIPTSNEQMMKLNYVLLHVNKFCGNL